MIRTVCNCKLHSMTGGLYHCEWHFPGNPARLGYQHHEDSCICWCRDDMPPRRRDVPCSPHFVVADEFSIFHDTDTHTQTDRRRDTHAHRHTAARKCLKSKVVPYSIVSVELISVSWQSAHRWLSDLVINPVVGCRQFPQGPQLLSQTKRSSPWPVPNYTAWWQRHTGVSSLPKATLQWFPAGTQTRDL